MDLPLWLSVTLKLSITPWTMLVPPVLLEVRFVLARYRTLRSLTRLFMEPQADVDKRPTLSFVSTIGKFSPRRNQSDVQIEARVRAHAQRYRHADEHEPLPKHSSRQQGRRQVPAGPCPGESWAQDEK